MKLTKNQILIVAVLAILVIIYFMFFHKKNNKTLKTTSSPSPATKESAFAQADDEVKCSGLLDCCIKYAEKTEPWKSTAEAKKDCRKKLGEVHKPKPEENGFRKSSSVNPITQKTLPINPITQAPCLSAFCVCMHSTSVSTTQDYSTLEAYCLTQTAGMPLHKYLQSVKK